MVQTLGSRSTGAQGSGAPVGARGPWALGAPAPQGSWAPGPQGLGNIKFSLEILLDKSGPCHNGLPRQLDKMLPEIIGFTWVN